MNRLPPEVYSAYAHVYQLDDNAPFTIDESIAALARDHFVCNYSRNWRYSKCSSLVGLVSSVGFGPPLYKLSVFFSISPSVVIAFAGIGLYLNRFLVNSRDREGYLLAGLVSFIGFSRYKSSVSVVSAIAFASISFALNRLWINTRNWEGYLLQDALKTPFLRNEDAIIGRLSEGANVYQTVWSCGGAAPELNPTVKGCCMTVMEHFATSGCAQVVAYLAMLEPDLLKRALMATEALSRPTNIATLRVLLGCGAKVQEMTDFYFSGERPDLALVQFLVKAGAKPNARFFGSHGWS